MMKFKMFFLGKVTRKTKKEDDYMIVKVQTSDAELFEIFTMDENIMKRANELDMFTPVELTMSLKSGKQNEMSLQLVDIEPLKEKK